MTSTCSNCYSNCSQITSDKCVKYTGVDIDVLGIRNGDSINYVAAAIAGFLASTLDASGIKYELDSENVCTLITDQLVDCTDITQKDISNALANVICSLDGRIDSLENFNTALEASYTPGCVPGINGTEGTRSVVQAVLNHLCNVATDLDALETDVATNYVRIADLDTYIQNFFNSLGGESTKQKDKMIPFTVIEYYGPLNNFDATGAGTGDWTEIFLCNGDNGTPDKRGRIAVGTTSGMGGGSFPANTNPLISGNPTYNLYSTTGTNNVTLNSSQIPAHTHTATMTSAGDHQHYILSFGNQGISFSNPNITLDEFWSSGGNSTYALRGNTQEADSGQTSTAGDHNHNITINPVGGGTSHTNIPPVLACHYIMYIPAS